MSNWDSASSVHQLRLHHGFHHLILSNQLIPVYGVRVDVLGVTDIGMPLGRGEGRKRVLAIVASILAARKLAQFDGGRRVPATISAIADAVRWAEEIMKTIDERWQMNRNGILKLGH